MADRKKLRNRLKPLVKSLGGTGVLVAGLLASDCAVDSRTPVTSDAVSPQDADDSGGTSGNLLPPDVTTFPDTGEPDTGISGNLLAPDVQEWEDADSGAPDSGDVQGDSSETDTTEPDTTP